MHHFFAQHLDSGSMLPYVAVPVRRSDNQNQPAPQMPAEACQTSCGGDVNLWTPHSLMLGAVGAVALGISTPTRCILSVWNLL